MIHFTSNGIGRQNGIRFETRYGSWLDGAEQKKPWFLYVEQTAAKDRERICTYTERTFRFSLMEEAMAFCEKIANGEVTVAQLKAAEDQALEARNARRREAGEARVDVFLDKLKNLGIDPVVFPDALRAFREMDAALDMDLKNLFFDRVAAMKASPEKAAPRLTFEQYLNAHQKDVDVCVCDKDTAEHYLPAVCYISPEELASGEYDYEPFEKWLLTLPVDRVNTIDGYESVLLRTDFSADQCSFLLGDDEFDSNEWVRKNLRAMLAGADFSARLAYLQEGKSFEVPFDGVCMDAADPEERMKLCSLLSSHKEVYIATYPSDESAYYAYAVQEGKDGKLHCSGTHVDVRHTEPGQGLVSTLDGKIYWAAHVGLRNQTAQQDPAKAGPTKEAQEVR